MIQRIQSIYLLICIILLVLVTLGAPIVDFIYEGMRYQYNSYGEVVINSDGDMVSMKSMPFYLVGFSLIFLAFITMMSYKNIKRQFKLGRMLFGIYFLIMIFVIIFPIFGASILDMPEAKREMGYGYILFIAGFPFTFLANTGIKRDKNLLDSLNRLR